MINKNRLIAIVFVVISFIGIALMGINRIFGVIVMVIGLAPAAFFLLKAKQEEE